MPTEKEKMLEGDPYDPRDPELLAEREHARKLTRAYNTTADAEDDRRVELLEDLFGSVGEGAHVEPPVRCDYGYNIHVGEAFYANVDCVFLDVREIRFGANCFLGPGVHVYAATHPIDAETRGEGLERGEPVTVGDDVWIGGRAVLTPGVTVGDRAVIGAGAVVTGDVPPDVIVGGNPAEVVKRVDGNER
jgi:maltose O-acetyltransferase